MDLGVWSFSLEVTLVHAWTCFQIRARGEKVRFWVWHLDVEVWSFSDVCVLGSWSFACPPLASFCEIPIWFCNAPNSTNPSHSAPIRTNPDQNFFRHSIGQSGPPKSPLSASRNLRVFSNRRLKPSQTRSAKIKDGGESSPAPTKVEIGPDSSRSLRAKVEIARDSSIQNHLSTRPILTYLDSS